MELLDKYNEAKENLYKYFGLGSVGSNGPIVDCRDEIWGTKVNSLYLKRYCSLCSGNPSRPMPAPSWVEYTIHLIIERHDYTMIDAMDKGTGEPFLFVLDTTKRESDK